MLTFTLWRDPSLRTLVELPIHKRSFLAQGMIHVSAKIMCASCVGGSLGHGDLSCLTRVVSPTALSDEAVRGPSLLAGASALTLSGPRHLS